MMAGRWVLGFGLVCSLGLAVACGSDDEDTKKHINGTGGSGGNTGGNSGTGGGNVGGSGGSTGGSGGNTGGASGSGGAAGGGGTAGANTGGAAGSNTGGAAGSNTGGAAGSNTGGAAGSNTGGAAGSNTGGAAGSNTGGTGGTPDAGVPNITPKIETATFWADCQPVISADPLHGSFDAKYDNAGSAAGALTITQASMQVVNGNQTMDWTFAVTPVSSGSVPAGGSKTTTHTKTPGSGSGTGAPCSMCNGAATITVEWTDGSSTKSSTLNAGSFQCVY